MSLAEFTAAVEAYQESQGQKPGPALDDEDIEELQEFLKSVKDRDARGQAR